MVSRLDHPTPTPAPEDTGQDLIGELASAQRMQEGMGLLLTNPLYSSSSPSLPEPSSPMPLLMHEGTWTVNTLIALTPSPQCVWCDRKLPLTESPGG